MTVPKCALRQLWRYRAPRDVSLAVVGPVLPPSQWQPISGVLCKASARPDSHTDRQTHRQTDSHTDTQTVQTASIQLQRASASRRLPLNAKARQQGKTLPQERAHLDGHQSPWRPEQPPTRVISFPVGAIPASLLTGFPLSSLTSHYRERRERAPSVPEMPGVEVALAAVSHTYTPRIPIDSIGRTDGRAATKHAYIFCFSYLLPPLKEKPMPKPKPSRF